MINKNFFLKKLSSLILKNKLNLLFLIAILIIYFINTIHFSYPDEFDNILGGRFITQGRLPYVGFFSHHGPFAFFFSAPIALFSGASFVKFRILLAIVYFSLSLAFIYFVNKRFGTVYSVVLKILWVFLVIGATFWWGQMILADSLAGYLFIALFIWLFLLILRKENFRKSDILLLSILNFLVVMTSLTYLYAAGIVYFFMIYWFLKSRDKKIKQILIFLAYLGAPYLIFLIYLVLTGSLYEYYYQAIFFNKEYYIQLVDGAKVDNPIRHLIIIFVNFMDKFRAVLLSVKDFNLGSPLNSTLALSNVFLMVYLFIRKRYEMVLFIFLLMIYLNTRSDPFAFAEKDYQSIPYVFFSLFNGIFLLTLLWKNNQADLSEDKKRIFTFFQLLLTIFFFFSLLMLSNKAIEKAYSKYMGKLPLIYDRPNVAFLMNDLMTKDDTYLMGPFEPEEQLYLKAKPATKYTLTIPAMDNADKIKTEYLSDLAKNRPKLIVYKTDDLILSKKAGEFLMPFLKENYFTIDDLNNPKEIYTVKYRSLGAEGNYDFTRYFFFDKNRKDEIIKMLIDKGLISPKT